MRKIVYTILISSTLLAFSTTFASWVRESGRTLFYVDTSFRTAGEIFRDGRKQDIADFTEANLSIYADYGVFSIYTVGLYFPALKVLTIDSTPVSAQITHLNIGDLDLIQRLQVYSIGGAVFNLEFLVGFPTGNDKEENGLFTGDGEYNFMPGISMGWGFDLFSFPSYVTLNCGVNVRTEGFSHEVHIGFQWGLFLYKKDLLFHLEIKRLQSLETEPEETINNGFWNNTSYTTYGLGMTYKLQDMGLSFYYKTVGQVNNAIGGHIFSLAFSYLL